MVGDGATDMQAKPPADLFIGYGGVVVREAVRDGADLFVTDLKVTENDGCLVLRSQ
jgi:phosphoserine phosphatase